MKDQILINGIEYTMNAYDSDIQTWNNYLYYNIETEEKNGVVYCIQYIFDYGTLSDISMALYEHEYLHSWNCRGWHDVEHYTTPQEAETIHNYIKEKGIFFRV